MSLRKTLLSSDRKTKQLIVAVTDFISVSLSMFLALMLQLANFPLNINYINFLLLCSIPSLTVTVFYLVGVYRSVLRYIDFALIYLLLKAIFLVFLIIILLQIFYLELLRYKQIDYDFSISYQSWAIGFLSSVVLIIGSRIMANYIFSRSSSQKRVVIFGAGSAGIQLAEALKVSSEIEPIAFVDSNKEIHGSYLGGLKIMDPKYIEKLVSKGKIDEVLIAIPSASKKILRQLLKEIENFSVKVRILPGLAEVAQGKVSVSELKEVDISDLLGRYEVEANKELLDSNIKDKVVMITGAGGSIGSEISKQVISNLPSNLILMDSNEYALYQIKSEIESKQPNASIYSVIGNVTNKNRIKDLCMSFKVDTIYHTAAYKHVPLVEENPFEAVTNNILGTKCTLEAAIESDVETFVLISTDKAVRPTNIMGATKRFAELILQSYSAENSLKKTTRMTMVRFGNVLGSSGSAVPLFQKQIREGGPVTVTDPNVTRYFMSIPEAAQLVIQAGAMGEGGDVFVLDMGEPVKIYELDKNLIKLSGMEVKDKDNPEGDIEIIFTGLRPGEKLYEELLIGNKVDATEHKQIYRAEEDFLPASELLIHLDTLKEAQKNGDVVSLINTLKLVVSGFTPEKEISDIIYQRRIK